MPQSNYARVPQLLGPRATTIEACAPRACVLPEKPGQRDAHAPQPESSPHLPQQEKALGQQQRPQAAKNQINNFVKVVKT